MHYFAFFSIKNDRKIELVILHTINPVKSTKWVTTFSLILFEQSIKEKFKIHEKPVTHFIELISFMVCKMTSSISRSFLLKKKCKIKLCRKRYLQNK